MNKRFELAAKIALGIETAELETAFYAQLSNERSKQAFNLLECASECDRLAEDIQRNSFYLAEKFAKYAEEVATKTAHWDSPTKYSANRDVEVDTVKLQLRVEELVRWMYILRGAEARDVMRAALSANFSGLPTAIAAIRIGVAETHAKNEADKARSEAQRKACELIAQLVESGSLKGLKPEGSWNFANGDSQFKLPLGTYIVNHGRRVFEVSIEADRKSVRRAK